MKIFGKNIVFVIDTSGTMRFVQKDDIPGLAMSNGTDKDTGTKASDEKLTKDNERLAKFWCRIEMAKRALLKALNGLDAEVALHIRVSVRDPGGQSLSLEGWRTCYAQTDDAGESTCAP